MLGLLGTCLSGAGPTVLALATDNCESIGERMKSIFNQEKHASTQDYIQADYMILEFDTTGVQVRDLSLSNSK